MITPQIVGIDPAAQNSSANRAVFQDPDRAISARPTHYFRRMRVFFREMLPLGRHALLAVVVYVAVAAFVIATAGATVTLWNVSTLVGIVSVLSLFLMVRLMDEIKDVDIDRRLFPHRPVPSGRVRLSDIRTTLGAVIALYLAVNLSLSASLWSALAVLGYALLMFRFFFVPHVIRRSLPLALVTHNPIIPMMLVHCASVAAAGQGYTVADLNWDLVAPFLLLTWAPLLAWELSRKIRAPQEETEYVTYSRVLGVPGAVALTLLVQSMVMAVGVYLFARLGLDLIYIAILAAALSISVAVHLRLLIRPRLGSSTLRVSAEIFGVGVYAAQLYAFFSPGFA